MSYIVKSSLGIEPTILPWNEVEKEKLIREKNKYLKKENKVIIQLHIFNNTNYHTY